MAPIQPRVLPGDLRVLHRRHGPSGVEAADGKVGNRGEPDTKGFWGRLDRHTVHLLNIWASTPKFSHPYPRHPLPEELTTKPSPTARAEGDDREGERPSRALALAVSPLDRSFGPAPPPAPRARRRNRSPPFPRRAATKTNPPAATAGRELPAEPAQPLLLPAENALWGTSEHGLHGDPPSSTPLGSPQPVLPRCEGSRGAAPRPAQPGSCPSCGDIVGGRQDTMPSPASAGSDSAAPLAQKLRDGKHRAGPGRLSLAAVGMGPPNPAGGGRDGFDRTRSTSGTGARAPPELGFGRVGTGLRAHRVSPQWDAQTLLTCSATPNIPLSSWGACAYPTPCI